MREAVRAESSWPTKRVELISQTSASMEMQPAERAV